MDQNQNQGPQNNNDNNNNQGPKNKQPSIDTFNLCHGGYVCGKSFDNDHARRFR